MERVLSPTEAIIEGRRTILVGTNNYLGLTFDAACVGGRRSTRWRPLRHGHHRLAHRQRQLSAAMRAWSEALARFYGREHAMVFTTGYQANLGIISTIAGPKDYLIIDADSPCQHLRRLQA